MAGELITQDGQYQFTASNGSTMLIGKGTQIRVLTVEGWLSQPEIRSSDIPLSGQEGGIFAGSDWYDVRRLQFEIGLEGTLSNPHGVETLLDTFHTVFRKRDSGILVGKRPNKIARRCTARVRRAEFTGSWDVHMGYAAGGLELVAADPRMYENNTQYESTQLPITTGGRTYVRIYPMLYGSSTIYGSVVVTNAGNIDSPPKIRIYGPVDVPRVLHVESGKEVRLNMSLLATDVVELDMRLHTVVLNGIATRRQSVDPSSKWWTLEPGQNQVRFMGNSGTGAHMEFDWATAWATG